MKKPNIIFFVPDSYRADVLAHQGNPGAVTPALDRVVADGAVSYTNAFAQNPVCTPSRCSFMTGWYPHTNGHRSMLNMLKDHEPNLLNVMQREGYHVWWGGKNDLVRVETGEDYLKYCDEKFDPSSISWEGDGYRHPSALNDDDPRRGAFYSGVARREKDGHPYRSNDEAHVRGAVEFLKNWRPDDKPFFLYLPLTHPHPAYLAEEDHYNSINPDLLPPRIPAPTDSANLPEVIADLHGAYGADGITEDMWREVKRVYYAMCSKIDALFGMLVETLKDEGLYDDTFIFFFSDHGDFAGDYSLPEKTHLTLQDSLIRVPLVIKAPAGVEVKPGNHGELVELVDLTATIYDLLGIEPGYDCQGVSLRDSLAGRDTQPHDAVFAEVGARKGEESFINPQVNKMDPKSFYPRQKNATVPHARAGSHAVSCRTEKHKYVRRFYTGHHELFDLAKDPGECRNVIGNPEYAEVERQMETRLLDFLLQTSDVLPHTQDSRGI